MHHHHHRDHEARTAESTLPAPRRASARRRRGRPRRRPARSAPPPEPVKPKSKPGGFWFRLSLCFLALAVTAGIISASGQAGESVVAVQAAGLVALTCFLAAYVAHTVQEELS